MVIRNIILEKGDYAILDIGDDFKQISLVYKFDKENEDWAYAVEYYPYEIYKRECSAPYTKAEALQFAIDRLRCKTEEDYISRCRLEELATVFKDKIIELDEEEAMYSFENEFDLSENEYAFFEI